MLRTGGRGGPLEKKIAVFSNDPETPQLTLSIGCEITVDVSVEPRQLVFGQIVKGEKTEQGFGITVHDPAQIKITGVTVDDDRFQLKMVEGDPAGSGKYVISFTGDKSVGRVATSVRVKYEGSSVPEVAVPVRGEIVGDLVYNRNLFFNKKDDAFPEREIEFSSRSKKAVKLNKVEDPDGKLATEIRYEDGGKKAVLVARVADQEASYDKPARFKLIVHTSDRDEPRVEIPYTIADRGRGPMRPSALGKRPIPVGPALGIEEGLRAKSIRERAGKALEDAQ